MRGLWALGLVITGACGYGGTVDDDSYCDTSYQCCTQSFADAEMIVAFILTTVSCGIVLVIVLCCFKVKPKAQVGYKSCSKVGDWDQCTCLAKMTSQEDVWANPIQFTRNTIDAPPGKLQYEAILGQKDFSKIPLFAPESKMTFVLELEPGSTAVAGRMHIERRGEFTFEGTITTHWSALGAPAIQGIANGFVGEFDIILRTSSNRRASKATRAEDQVLYDTWIWRWRAPPVFLTLLAIFAFPFLGVWDLALHSDMPPGGAGLWGHLAMLVPLCCLNYQHHIGWRVCVPLISLCLGLPVLGMQQWAVAIMTHRDYCGPYDEQITAASYCDYNAQFCALVVTQYEGQCTPPIPQAAFPINFDASVPEEDIADTCDNLEAAYRFSATSFALACVAFSAWWGSLFKSEPHGCCTDCQCNGCAPSAWGDDDEAPEAPALRRMCETKDARALIQSLCSSSSTQRAAGAEAGEELEEIKIDDSDKFGVQMRSF